MRYSTILLDLDHTLFDSDTSETAAFSQAMRVAGIDEAAPFMDLYQQINVALWSAVERGEVKPQQVRTLRFERFVDAAGLDADPLLMADTFVAGLASCGELYAAAGDVIEALSKRASLAMVTNGLGEVQRARIDRLGIGKYFDAITISAEVGAAKPGREIFDIVFQSLGNPPKESAVMVGDSLSSDIRGGSDYGIASCWYNPHGRTAGAADRITHEIRDLRELLQIT